MSAGMGYPKFSPACVPPTAAVVSLGSLKMAEGSLDGGVMLPGAPLSPGVISPLLSLESLAMSPVEGGESDRSRSAPFHLEKRRIDKDVMHILRLGADIDRTGICPSR